MFAHNVPEALSRILMNSFKLMKQLFIKIGHIEVEVIGRASCSFGAGDGYAAFIEKVSTETAWPLAQV